MKSEERGGQKVIRPAHRRQRLKQGKGKARQANASSLQLRIRNEQTQVETLKRREKYRRWSPEDEGRRCSGGGGLAAQFWRSLHLWSLKKETLNSVSKRGNLLAASSGSLSLIFSLHYLGTL